MAMVCKYAIIVHGFICFLAQLAWEHHQHVQELVHFQHFMLFDRYVYLQAYIKRFST